jgi:prolyl-tRNA synthetase
VVAVPIYKTEEDLNAISAKIIELGAKLKAKGISFKYDDDDNRRPGWKFSEYESKGVPVRLAMGMRDFENGNIEVARRDEKTKEVVAFDGVEDYIENLLKEIQDNLLNKAQKHRVENTQIIDSYDDFKVKIESEGGFFLAHWDGTAETEAKVKEETKATIRCIPFDQPKEAGKCMVTGKPSAGRVIFAKAY